MQQHKSPFQVWKIDPSQRIENDLITLRNWLKGIDFFTKYPEIIMDRVCEKLRPVKYSKNDVIIEMGDDVNLFLTYL